LEKSCAKDGRSGDPRVRINFSTLSLSLSFSFCNVVQITAVDQKNECKKKKTQNLKITTEMN
jgi:hypothetical protein